MSDLKRPSQLTSTTRILEKNNIALRVELDTMRTAYDEQAVQLAAANERIADLEKKNQRLEKLLRQLRKAAFEFVGLATYKYTTEELHRIQDAYVYAMEATREFAHNLAPKADSDAT